MGCRSQPVAYPNPVKPEPNRKTEPQRRKDREENWIELGDLRVLAVSCFLCKKSIGKILTQIAERAKSWIVCFNHKEHREHKERADQAQSGDLSAFFVIPVVKNQAASGTAVESAWTLEISRFCAILGAMTWRQNGFSTTNHRKTMGARPRTRVCAAAHFFNVAKRHGELLPCLFRLHRCCDRRKGQCHAYPG